MEAWLRGNLVPCVLFICGEGEDKPKRAINHRDTLKRILSSRHRFAGVLEEMRCVSSVFFFFPGWLQHWPTDRGTNETGSFTVPGKQSLFSTSG